MHNTTLSLSDQLKAVKSNTMATWGYNLALNNAIEVIREVLREENSCLSYETASNIQKRLHRQKI